MARAYGLDPDDVWQRPFHETLLTLWTLLELEDHDRTERFVEDVRRAGMAAFAFHEPKGLSRYEHEAKERAGLLETIDDVRRRALDQVRRIREGKVLDGAD